MVDQQHKLPFKESKQLLGHSASVACVVWNKKGEYLISASFDKTVRLWNPFNGNLIKIYRGHGYQVVSVDVHTDNSQIASCGGDKQPYLWDVSSGKVIRKFKGHDQHLNCVKFNKECSVLVTGSFDTTAKVWDCRSRSFDPIEILSDAKDSVDCILVLDHTIVTGSRDGKLRQYDLRMGELRVDTVGHPISSVSISRDENILLVSSLDSTIRTFDVDDGTMYQSYVGHSNTGFAVKSSFSNTDAEVLSGSEDGKLFWWNLEDAKVIHSSQAHRDTVCYVDYHPDKPYVVTASMDKSIKIWSTA